MVYRAFHPNLKRTVALKVLTAGEGAGDDAIARFRREAESLARMGHHPNIVPIYDVGEEGRNHYFAMHLVEGRSVESMISAEDLAPRTAAEIARKIALALHHAHSHGILHRDVKPGNILVSAEGEPQITDFGLARDVRSESRLTKSGLALGTPLYMPPEQADGRMDEVDGRSDVYSLGAALYEMLAFRPPFEASTLVNVVCDILLKDPDPVRRHAPDVDADLETVCMKCLEKDPAGRYESAKALAEDLGRYLAGEPVLAKPPGVLRRISRWAGRRKAAIAGAAVGAVAVAAGSAAIFAFREQAAAPQPPAPAASAEDPSREAARKKASVLMERGRTALENARRAELVSDPASRRSLLLDAGREFDRACEADPENAEAFVEKGRVMLLLERRKEALEAMDRAVALNPGLTEPYYYRIRIRYQDFLLLSMLVGDEGVEKVRLLVESDLARIREIGTNLEFYHCGLAILHAVSLDMDEAQAEAEKAVAVNRMFADSYAVLASVRVVRSVLKSGTVDKGDLEKALSDATTALKLSGGDSDVRFSRATLLATLDRNEEALEEAEYLVKAAPDKPHALFLRARLRCAMGDAKGFRDDLEAAEALPYDTPEAHFVAGGAVFLLMQTAGPGGITKKDMDRALGHLDAILEEFPSRSDVRGVRGLILLFSGRVAEAADDFTMFLDRHGNAKIAPAVRVMRDRLIAGRRPDLDSPEVSYQTARTMLAAGNRKEAARRLEETLARLRNPGPAYKKRPADMRRFIEINTRIDLAALLSEDASASEDAKAAEPLVRRAMDLVDEAVRFGFREFHVVDMRNSFRALRNDPDFRRKRKEWGGIN